MYVQIVLAQILSFAIIALTRPQAMPNITEERATIDTGRTGTGFEYPLRKGSKKMGSAFHNFINM